MKRILSLILSAAVIFSVFSFGNTVLAQDEKEENKDVVPIIVVPGIGSSSLYANSELQTQSNIISVDRTLFKTLRETHIGYDFYRIIRGKRVEPSTFINKLSTATSFLTSLNCDEEGNSRDWSGIDCFWKEPLSKNMDYLDSRNTAEPAVCKAICDEVGAENVWIFNYDFRLNVINHAWQLSMFIDEVKRQTGSIKVNIVSASLGSCVVSAYIDRYGMHNQVAKYVFLDAAFQGTSMGKLFAKDLVVDKNEINKYLELLSECYAADTMDFSKAKNIIGRFDNTVQNLLDYIMILADEDNIDALYSRVILPVVGNMPALWQCIPYDDFDKAVETMVELQWLDPDGRLFETIQEYHVIQGNLEKNLKDLQRTRGVEVAIVCGYGLPQIPFTDSANNQSDMLIDTCYASFGGTAANAGEQVKNATSPDGFIDASSCKFENNTWFLKGVQHMEFVYGTDVSKFVAYLVATNDKLNVESVKKAQGYSQYMEIDAKYNMNNIEKD